MSNSRYDDPYIRFSPGFSPFMPRDPYVVMLQTLRMLQDGLGGTRCTVTIDESVLLDSVDFGSISPNQIQRAFPMEGDVRVVRCHVRRMSMQVMWMFGDDTRTRRFTLTDLQGSKYTFWKHALSLFKAYSDYLKPEWASCLSWNLFLELYARYALNEKCLPPTRENIEWIKELYDNFDSLLEDVRMNNDEPFGWMGVLPEGIAIDEEMFPSFSFVEKEYGTLYMARESLLGKVCDEVADQLYTMYRLICA